MPVALVLWTDSTSQGGSKVGSSPSMRCRCLASSNPFLKSEQVGFLYILTHSCQDKSLKERATSPHSVHWPSM